MTEAAQFPADNERISTAPQQESGTPDTLRTITGKVTDADSQEGLVGASVRLVGTHYGVRTDINGCFSLDVSSDTLVESEQVLEFSSIGYTLQTLHLSGLKNPVNFQIRMDPATLGLVGDISISHSTFKQRLKRFFHWNR